MLVWLVLSVVTLGVKLYMVNMQVQLLPLELVFYVVEIGIIFIS